ncbi:MAG: two-component system response regulator [Methylovulum miyakonense]|uniref:HD-GYP domain-containing protein n=1 Tax=Methylovulum miyakonense TaxID=645578 RepID=UPI003BB60137
MVQNRPDPIFLNFADTSATVLIVDDTPENLVALGETLSPIYQVLLAGSGLQALGLATAIPDIILLNIMMPDMDGYEIVNRLRENSQTANIPFIILTATDIYDDKQYGFGLGAVDYITKPIRQPIVLARVKNQLELKFSRDWLINQNSLLETEIDRRLSENQLIQQVSINALARLAEIRDPETGNHILRTQTYVNALAKKLQNHPRFESLLTPYYIQQLTQSTPLHDIGKVGIPDHILQKPGKLSAEEWEIMKTHARLGFDAIDQAERDCAKPVTFLTIAKQITLSHHEKWDGSGYPEGLSGEAIPIPARLMALADAFDALISRRVYKPALPFTEAHDYIVSQRGRHFDPDIVDAFTAIFPEFLAIAGRHTENSHRI